MSLSEKMRLNSSKSRMVKVNYFQFKGLYMLMPRIWLMPRIYILVKSSHKTIY